MTKNRIFKKLYTLSVLTILTIPSIFGASEPLTRENWDPFNRKDLKNNHQRIREGLVNFEGMQSIDIAPAIDRIPMPNGQTQKTILSTEEVRQQLALSPEVSPEQATEIVNRLTNNITLKGLFLDRGAQARATIIFTPGFCPGRKEGFAPFVRIAPADCNLLFLELRGHGESTSKSFCSNVASCVIPGNCGSSLPCPTVPCCGTPASLKDIGLILGAKDYGKHEHKDIIGAIMDASRRTNGKPIILFGWCAGAFLTAGTIIKLNQFKQQTGLDLIRKYNVQGLLFDSGFVSLKKMMDRIKQHKNQKMLPSCLASIGKKINGLVDGITGLIGKILPRSISESLSSIASSITQFLFPKTKENVPGSIINGISSVATTGLLGVLKFLLGRQVKKYDPQTRLDDKMNLLEDLPVLFIHSSQDSLAPFEDIQNIHRMTQNSELWETGGDHHARNHLNHTDAYRVRMSNWLQATIQEAQPGVNGNVDNVNAPQSTAIQEIIRIIDEIIQFLINPTQNQEDIQKADRQFQELDAALHNPVNNIPQEAIHLFDQMVAKIENETITNEEVLDNLLKMRKILAPGQTQPNPEQNTQYPNQNPNQNNQEKNNQEERHALPRSIHALPSITGSNSLSDQQKPNCLWGSPGSGSVSGSDSGSRLSRPSSSYNNYCPSSSYPYDNYYNQNTGQPSYPGSTGNYSGSGYDDYPWSGGTEHAGTGNQMNENKQESPSVTKYDFMFLDEEYEPEMKDQPDEKSFFYKQRNDRF